MKTAGRIWIFSLSVALLTITCSMASAKQNAKECQILDALPESVYEFDFEYIPSSDVEDLGKTDIIGVNADWSFAYFRAGAVGDIDLNLRAASTIFHNSVNGVFPSQVAKVALDAGWALRFDKGFAFQMRAAPGVYSDFNNLSSDSLSYPFSVALIRAYDPGLSAMAGLEIRPDFNLPVMPLFGVVWTINDYLKLDARCPRSKLTFYPASGWNTYLALDWINTTYDVSGDADRMTMDYFKAYFGVAHQISNQALVRAEFGTIFERSAKYENLDSDRTWEVDIDRAFFFRLGMGAAF
jgi:hypothetical protein